MEFASRLRWLIIISLGLVAVLLIGWGLISIAGSIFNPGDDSSDTSSESTEKDVNTTSQAKYLVDGPVIANENHRSYEISVSSTIVTMKVFKGYDGEVLSVTSYLNTQKSYDNFLSALEQQGVTDRKKNTNEETDYSEQGVCASGKRYILELDADFRRWSTNCNSKFGTAEYNNSAVQSLFKKQVPDYSDIVRGSGL